MVRENSRVSSDLQQQLTNSLSKIEELENQLSTLQEKHSKAIKEYLFVKEGAMKLSEIAVSESERLSSTIRQLEDTIDKLSTQLEMKQSLLETAMLHRDELMNQQSRKTYSF